MTERRKYDVEQYGEVLCWGVLHGFRVISSTENPKRKSLKRKKRKRVGARRPETSRSSSPALSDCKFIGGN